jgi:hypothetical protein
VAEPDIFLFGSWFWIYKAGKNHISSHPRTSVEVLPPESPVYDVLKDWGLILRSFSSTANGPSAIRPFSPSIKTLGWIDRRNARVQLMPVTHRSRNNSLLSGKGHFFQRWPIETWMWYSVFNGCRLLFRRQFFNDILIYPSMSYPNKLPVASSAPKVLILSLMSFFQLFFHGLWRE